MHTSSPWSFTYEGQLLVNKQLANGFYDLRFEFFDAPEEGAPIAEALERLGVLVVSGQFRLNLSLDPHALAHPPLWVQISVKPHEGPAAWTSFARRQEIQPVPLAAASQFSFGVLPGAIDSGSIAPRAVRPEHIASGAAVTSINGITNAALLQAGPGLSISTDGSAIIIQMAGPQPRAPFEISFPGGVRPFTDLRQAILALEDGNELIIRSNYTASPQPVWDGANPLLASLPLVGKKRVRVKGVNYPVISAQSFGDLLYIRNCETVTVEGLILEGASVTTGEDPLPMAALLNLGGTNVDLTIRDCRFQNFPSHGISHLWSSKTSTQVRVTACVFENIGNPRHPFLGIDGAAISGIGSRWVVSKNTIRNVLRGIEVEGPGPAPMSNIIISDNLLESIWNEGIMIFATSGRAADFTDIIISGNVVSGSEKRPEGVPVQTGISVNGGERITVSRNHVHSFKEAIYGIGLTAAMADLRDSTVIGNTVSNCEYRGIQAFQTHFKADNIIVADNQVRGAYDGILISGKRHSVRGNVVSNCLNTGIGVGEWPWDLVEEVNVSGNVITRSGNIGISVQAGARGTFIHGNRLHENDFESIDDRGSDTYLASNQVR